MKQDLKPFYETAHKIYQELLTVDNIPYKKVFNPSLLHENQFQNLLNVLAKIGLIIQKVAFPEENELITITGIKKGKELANFTNWLPSDTSVLNRNRNEYYLLYLEYDKKMLKPYSFQHKTKLNSETIYILSQVYSNSEIFSILLGINKGGRNFIQKGNQSFPPFFPNDLLIYDLTNLDGYTTKHTREGFQELLDQIKERYSEIDESILSRIGKNVTSKLGYDLEDIKLPYFETYFRLNHFFPEFEEILLDELYFPQKIESQPRSEPMIEKSSEVAVGEVKSEINTNKLSNEKVGDELDEHRILFKYGLYFPTIKDDHIEPCFNVKNVASVFADHISKLQEETGQMVGIFGKWGRGKTYFKKEVEGIFKNENSKYNFTIIDFHAWKYQDTPAIWAYLYECLSDKYFGSEWFCKSWRKLKLNFQREKSNIVKDLIFLGVVWSLFTGILSLFKSGNSSLIGNLIDIIQNYWWQTISGGTIISSLLKFWRKEGTDARELLKKYSKGISFNQHLGVQAEIEKELVILLKTWIAEKNKERLILFVDDIDRCSEKKIIEIVDSLRVMLEHPEIVKRVIVLVAIDEEKLAMAIRYKYREFYPPTSDNSKILDDLTREYMDKLFISGIKLQALNSDNVNEFISTLVAQDWKDITQNRLSPEEKTPKEQVHLGRTELTIANEKKEEALSESGESSLTMNENAKNETYLEELEASDVKDMFREEFMELKEELTPRQIRILYYRFQLAKNLYIKLLDAENDQLITDGLKGLLKAIHIKTVSKKDHFVEDPIIDQIAEMVVGY
ncbi:MAG: KAP family NTPase [Prolixibacteraceae bacterium]|nr:KAP family NTPase [Prolixibacteraceae bacterium]